MNNVMAPYPKYRLKYSIDPSFYSGAMYVSYGVETGVAIVVYALTLLFGLDLGPLGILLCIIMVLILLMTYIRAVSKSIWDLLFFKYDATIAQ